MIKAIFFDFNGVIVDDERLQMQVYQEVLREQGISLTESEYYDALGMDDQTFVRKAFERAGRDLPNELLQAMIEDKTVRHRQLIENELPLFPGVVTFLKASFRHYALGLVSMSNVNELSYVLEQARLKHLFSVIVTAEDVNVCKPAPDCYRIGLARLNEKRGEARLLPLRANECLVIEDAPAGIESGRLAGMRTLAITNTVGEEPLRSAGAEVVTRSLFDWTVDAVEHVYL